MSCETQCMMGRGNTENGTGSHGLPSCQMLYDVNPFADFEVTEDPPFNLQEIYRAFKFFGLFWVFICLCCQMLVSQHREAILDIPCHASPGTHTKKYTFLCYSWIYWFFWWWNLPRWVKSLIWKLPFSWYLQKNNEIEGVVVSSWDCLSQIYVNG